MYLDSVRLFPCCLWTNLENKRQLYNQSVGAKLRQDCNQRIPVNGPKHLVEDISPSSSLAYGDWVAVLGPGCELIQPVCDSPEQEATDGQLHRRQDIACCLVVTPRNPAERLDPPAETHDRMALPFGLAIR